MSGIEVVGLILGAFPIVMSALESYRKAFEPLKSWWKFQRTFEDFMDDLGTQSTLFDNNLEKLLSPFVDSDTHMGILLSDPMGPAWRESQLDNNLRLRLGSSYPFYKSIIGRMNDALNDLQALLGIKQGQAIALWAKRDPYRWELELELRRFRIAFSKKKFNQVSTLSRRNDELARLLQTSDELAPSRKRRQTGPNTAFLRKIQNHAYHLHAALDGAWQCDCEWPHYTSLRLEKRISQGSMTGEHWKLLLALEHDVSVQVPWQEMEIQVMEGSDTTTESGQRSIGEVSEPPLRNSLHKFKDDIELRLSQATIPDSLSGSTIISATSLFSSTGGDTILSSIVSNTIPYRTHPRPKKRVGFAQSMPTVDELPQSLPFPSPERLACTPHIQNICFTMKSIDGTSACLGFLRDRQNRRHLLLPLYNQHSALRSQRKLTLQNALQRPGEDRPCQAMTRQERFTVAVILASSLLQLHSTPWLCDRWSKKDVTFLSDESQPHIVFQPFVCTEFHSINAPSRPPPPPNGKFNTKMALSSLGIMLLELCFGKAIEDHPLREQYFGPNNQPNAFTDISTAKEWHEDVLAELGDDISDAIRRCLDCSFAPKPNLEDKEFQEAVFDGVVLPLQDLLKVWEGS